MDSSQPVKLVTGFLEEFKQFALKGNLIDLAVGIVIGTAFTNVVKALVDHIFMPIISYVTPDQNYRNWMFGKIEIGAFISQVVNFAVVSFVVFLVVVKLIGYLMRRRAEAVETPKVIPEDIALLTEIRDLLQRQAQVAPRVDERPDTLL